MKSFTFIAAIVAFLPAAEGSWWWPFGGGDDGAGRQRISDLIEPASLFIDAATDLRNDGKYDEAVAEYRKALAELDRIELENPERAATTEFATVRNKRAFVNAAIDTIFLEQATRNSKAVALTDTAELERKYAEEQERKKKEANIVRKPAPGRGRDGAADGGKARSANREAALAVLSKDPGNKKARLIVAAGDLAEKRYGDAMEMVSAVLEDSPDDAAALNLKGLVELERGNLDEAESVFRRLVETSPTRHFGYYNLAKTILKKKGDAGRDEARKLYFGHGREYCGGPVDGFLEEALK